MGSAGPRRGAEAWDGGAGPGRGAEGWDGGGGPGRGAAVPTADLSRKSRGIVTEDGSVTETPGSPHFRSTSSGVTNSWPSIDPPIGGQIRAARFRPPKTALWRPSNVTFPASLGSLRHGSGLPGLRSGQNDHGSVNPCLTSATPPGTPHGSPTSPHPCAVSPTNPSRPGRLVAATARPGRHETPGTHLGRPEWTTPASRRPDPAPMAAVLRPSSWLLRCLLRPFP